MLFNVLIAQNSVNKPWAYYRKEFFRFKTVWDCQFVRDFVVWSVSRLLAPTIRGTGEPLPWGPSPRSATGMVKLFKHNVMKQKGK